MRYLTALLSVLIVFALQSKQLNAQTSVCDEIWSGTIVLDSDVVVEEGCTLSIEPGTSIAGADYSISIFGALEAIGAADNPIQFNVRALNSHCGHDSFLIQHAEVNESNYAGAYSNHNSYLPGLTGMLNYCRTNNLDWRAYLDTMQGAVLYENEAAELGVYDENFDDQEHQGWTSYRTWINGYYWQQNQDLSSDSFYLNSFASANCSGGSGHWGTMSPEIFFENPGEYPVHLSFLYQFSAGEYFTDQMPMEYAINGETNYDDTWYPIETFETTDGEFVNFDLELNFSEPIESLRFRWKRFYSCPTWSSYTTSTLLIEDFKLTTNYSPTTESVPFEEAVLDDFSSGGMTLDSVDWGGSISVAGDDCVYNISNSSFEPTQSYQAGVSIQGHGNSLNLNDCSMEGGFDAALHLEDGENCNVYLLRSSIRTSNVQGLFIGSGWNGQVLNTRISDQTGSPGVVADVNGTILLNYCTISNNGQEGIRITGNGALELKNSIVWGNNLGNLAQITNDQGLVEIAYSTIQGLSGFGVSGEGTFSSLDGNLELNPQFASEASFELEPFSPCVDAGEPYFDDAYRPPGKGQARSDMGWHGGPHLLPIGAFGCTDAESCNYNPDAVSDDNSCAFPEEYYDCSGNCTNDFDGDGICDELETNEDQYSDGYAAGYAAGVLAGQESCESLPSNVSCGPGTYWDEFYNLCLPIEVCPGDLNDDGIRGVNDLLLLLSYFGYLCEE